MELSAQSGALLVGMGHAMEGSLPLPVCPRLLAGPACPQGASGTKCVSWDIVPPPEIQKKGYEVIKFLAKGDAPQQNFITS